MSILSKIFSRSAALTSFALALLLTACSGSNPDLSAGVALTTKSASFGQPASADTVVATSQELASYFNGQYASNPQALMGAKAGNNNKAGIGSLAVAASNARQSIFRFYNTATSIHFFTMSADERAYVKATFPSFIDEGIGFYAYPNPDPELSPVYRFYNKVTGGHFYTISTEEKDHVIATWPEIFSFEGSAWYASTTSAPNLIPMYRFFNTKTGAHFYTTSAEERDHVLATWSWFTFEGIAYYVGETAADPIVVPPVVPDTTAPDIIVLGANPLNLTAGTVYTEPGASCIDNKDATCTVVITGTVNTATAGTYTITYTATDAAGNVRTKTRTVVVTAVPDTTAPVITVLGTNPLTLPGGTPYTEAGATCVDNKDATCTVVTTGTVNTATVGTYTITYTATDAAGNVSSKTRTVTVAACTADAFGSTGYSLVFKGCSAANVAEYYDKTECVRQNSSGLIWQGQTAVGTGLRANDQYKTNYDSSTELQKQYGQIFVAPTQGEIDAPTNSIGFKNAVNDSNLCGSGAWRLPTKDELAGIVKINPAAPMIDTDWFPNSTSKAFWSASPVVGDAGWAANVYFLFGSVSLSYRSAALPVRLVRASQ